MYEMFHFFSCKARYFLANRVPLVALDSECVRMVRDSNNNIGFERLLKKYTSRFFMYNLILPLEICQYLFKRCSLRNMKSTFSCLTFIRRMRYVTTGPGQPRDNKLSRNLSFTLFAKKYRALQLKRRHISNITAEVQVCLAYIESVFISLQRDGYVPIVVALNFF